MDSRSKPPSPLSAPFLTRRRLLGAGCLGLAAGLLGGPALLAATSTPMELFMRVSRRLCGRDDLDSRIGKRLFEALTQRRGQFEQGLAELAGRVEQPIAQWSREQQDLARDLLRGWYLGQVDQYDEALVITYEGALMFSAPADIQTVTSYCAGRPGFWAEKPVLVRGSA